MSAQGISRKRPAPGSVPIGQQPLQPLPQYPAASPQLSDDQFLRWGQNPQVNGAAPSYPDPSNFNNPTYGSNQTNVMPSTQLTRRPTNQLANRGKPYSDSGGTWVDPSQGPTEPVEGSWTEKDEDLEQKAQLAKRDAMSKRKQIPPFVQKLASFLEQSKNTELIRWSDDGNSFIVLDEDEFAKNLIPELFKHNNYASFVRQLNMYGFHKKVGLSDNSMRASEKKNKSPSEYSNPYFKRGHPELLWLIQKPKNAPGQGPKASGKAGIRVKAESDGIDDDLNDDYADGDFTATEPEEPRTGGGTRPKGPLLIRQGDGLPQEQLASVHRELQNIRQQQQVISGAINKLRREHEQLYGQAANFQSMHDRHENSITAILTFLATVYNRSLEGHGAQNMANMFAGVIPPNQNQGNVVDVGDISYDLNTDGSQVQRPFKKQPLLLKAPPAAGQDGQSRASTVSPSATGSPFERPQTRQYMSQMQQMRANQNDQLRNIEEVTDPATPQYMANQAQQAQNRLPQRDIMSVIQNTNARNNLPGMSPNASDFPTVLTSLENSDGNSPLTPSQRADMLRLIANGTNAHNENNNALMSPNPPQMPDLSHMARTRDEISELVRMQSEQDKSVQNLTNLLQPLSPTGSIPGLTDNSDFNGMGSIPPALDLDQIFNSGDYFNDSLLGNDYNLDSHGDPSGNNDFNFDDFGGDGANDNGLQSGVPDIVADDGNGDGGGRIIEAVNSSEGTSPATTADENGSLSVGYGDDYGERSPSKRRRKNR